VALDRYQVVVVELACLQPLTEPRKSNCLATAPVGPDNVDLDVVAAGPVAADHRRGGDALGGQQPGEGSAGQWLDGVAAPVGPALISRH
jgi:hypothetical protein